MTILKLLLWKHGIPHNCIALALVVCIASCTPEHPHASLSVQATRSPSIPGVSIGVNTRTSAPLPITTRTPIQSATILPSAHASATPSYPSHALCHQIQEVGGEGAIDNAQGGIRFDGWTSYWQRGSIPSQIDPVNQACAPVYIIAIRPWDPTIAWGSAAFYAYLHTPPSHTGYPSITILADDVWPLYRTFYRTWTCPRSIGAIDITAITPGFGFEGIITFTSLAGTTGTFDMATEKWQFTN